MNELLRRLGYLLHRRQFDNDLEEELRDHLNRKVAGGASVDEARRQFGNVTSILEESRDLWTWTWLEQLGQDIRYALRTILANRLFTAMVVLSLALGIGANTAIYSFMDAILVRALPVHHPEELVILNWRAKKEAPVVQSHWGSNYEEPGGGQTSPNFPYQILKILGEHNNVLSSLFGYVEVDHLNFVFADQAEIVNSQCVTGGYFAGLGVPAALGRLIGPEDDRQAAEPVIVLSFEYWQSRFGADPGVIGKAAKINETPVTISGVAAPEFLGVSPQSKPHVFIPIAHLSILRQQQETRQMFEDGHTYWIELLGRLKPGVSLAAAESQLAVPFHQFVESTATKDREREDLPRLWLQPGGSGVDALRRQFSKPLWTLMTMVGLILLIACANIANLLLARASSRRREMAVRLGLGATRLRIMRQLLTESVILAVAGGAGGLGVAVLGIQFLIPIMTNSDDGLSLNVGLNWRVLGFTLLIALATGILFGMAPALDATRVDITPALKETRASHPRSRSRWGIPFGLSHVLVIAQIGISFLLVVSAGLFMRTLANLHAVKLGFNAEHVLLFNIDASRAGFKDAALRRFYDRIQSRLQTLPGVRAATTSDMPLVGGWASRASIGVPGIPEPREGEHGPNTAYVQVGTTFFETMEIPIVAGRALGKHDVEGAPPVAVVNQVFAEKYFPGQNPIGRHFLLGGAANPNRIDLEIVGVARTARYNSLKREIPPVTYLSWLQGHRGRRLQFMYFEVRTTGDPLALSNTVRQVVREASKLVPVQGITTQTRRIDRTIAQERGFAQLCSCFGGLALLIACVGLYGTTAYNVARRTNEIGIRMALGAARGHIVWMVLREVLVLCIAGAVIGFVGGSQAIKVVQSFLFNLKPNDPPALLLSAAILLACALLAGFLPARRAASINPVEALRAE